MNKRKYLTHRNHTPWPQTCKRIIISSLNLLGLLTLNACTLTPKPIQTTTGQTKQPSNPVPQAETTSINSDTHVTHLPSNQHNTPLELIGTHWIVDQLLPGGLMDRQYLTIVLHPNGQMTGHLQRRTYTGQYKLPRTHSNHNATPKENYLTPIRLLPTHSQNPEHLGPPIQAQRQHNAQYLKTLQEITHYRIDEQGALRLYSAHNQLRILARP